MKENSWIPIPVKLSSFDLIKEAVFEAAGNTPQTRKALLVCDEVLTNIVSYSGAETLAFSCRRQDDLLCIAFSDDGAPFDLTSAPEQRREFQNLDNGGMGIHIIRQSAAKIRYSSRNGFNTLSLEFPVEESHGL